MSKFAHSGRRGTRPSPSCWSPCSARPPPPGPYWSQPRSGSASGHVGSLPLPRSPAPLPAAESVTLTWTAVTRPRVRHRQLLRQPRRRRPSSACPQRLRAQNADELHRHGRVAGDPQLHGHGRLALVDRDEHERLGAGDDRPRDAPAAGARNDDADCRLGRQPDDHRAGREQQHRDELPLFQEPHLRRCQHDRRQQTDRQQLLGHGDQLRHGRDDQLRQRCRESLGLEQRCDDPDTKAETAKITVSDGTLTNGAGTSVTVGSATASAFTLPTPSTQTAAAPFSDTLTAIDSYGNTATTYRAASRSSSRAPPAARAAKRRRIPPR